MANTKYCYPCGISYYPERGCTGCGRGQKSKVVGRKIIISPTTSHKGEKDKATPATTIQVEDKNPQLKFF